MLIMQTKGISLLIAGVLVLILAASPALASENAGNVASPIFVNETSLDATIAASTVVRGDTVTVTGQATGSPSDIRVWVIGKEYSNLFGKTLNGDGQFTWSIDKYVTDIMTDDQYYVIVQAPGNNNEFDVHVVSNGDVFIKDTKVNMIKVPYGFGSLRGTDAKETLVSAFDSEGSDDLYQELSFTFVDPTPTPTPAPTETPTPTPTPTVTETPTPTPTTTIQPTDEPTPEIVPLEDSPEPDESSVVSTEDLSEKISGLESRVDQQQVQIEQQQSIIDQIINFLKSIFNWE